VVVQRVARAEVRVAEREPARIGRGFLLLVGLAEDDDRGDLAWMAKKIAGLRLFPDDDGRMNRSLDEIDGRCLAVSQFTLLGDVTRGRRPSFIQAMEPQRAAALFDEFVAMLTDATGHDVLTGVFGAHMDVELVNDGPVTLVIEAPSGAR